jgi:hypothetical protein
MRKSAKLITALSVAGLIGIAGSAFTAASSIDQGIKVVGATSQTITGVHVSSVQYTVGAADTTTGVTFHVTENLTANPAAVNATISDGATTPATDTATCTLVAAGTTVGGTDLTCTFTTGVAGVTSLSIVAS